MQNPVQDSVLPPIRVLPGEAEVDDALVAGAVAEINRLHLQKTLETVRELGEYLLQTFFAGDIAAFEERGEKHASFRAVSAHGGLRVSHTTLWYAVKIIPHLRALPPAVAEALPLSHHRILVHVKDPSLKQELAMRAAREGLNKQALAEAARAVRPSLQAGGARGRKPLPSFVRSFRRIERVTAELESTSVDEASVKAFGVDRAAGYLSELNSVLSRLEGLRDQLAAQIAGMGEDR